MDAECRSVAGVWADLAGSDRHLDWMQECTSAVLHPLLPENARCAQGALTPEASDADNLSGLLHKALCTSDQIIRLSQTTMAGQRDGATRSLQSPRHLHAT